MSARRFRDYEHLLRLVAVFVLGFAGFAGARAVLVPHDYGRFGPYRAAALDQNRAKPISYAGQRACIECHDDVGVTKKANAHAGVACETCHGPHAAHAADPAVAARKPDPRAVCATCHVPSAAKPAAMKTVNFAEHADGPCTACHPAHAPRTW